MFTYFVAFGRNFAPRFANAIKNIIINHSNKNKMKKENLMKVAVAVALLFAVNMEADAQFGNLLNKANSPANIERRAMPKAGSLNS